VSLRQRKPRVTDITDFHCHRFRHTAAMHRLTAKTPLTIEKVAEPLGNSVKVAERTLHSLIGNPAASGEEKLAAGWKRVPKLVRVKRLTDLTLPAGFPSNDDFPFNFGPVLTNPFPGNWGARALHPAAPIHFERNPT
jgi:hypothetical protein